MSVGTQRIVQTQDKYLQVAFNQNVLALRELQSIVIELLNRVAALEGEE